VQPTKNQLKVIEYIEANLSITFPGGTKDDARLFISAHMEESKRVRQIAPDGREILQSEYVSEYGLWHMDVYGEQY
jgi:hypothetical protein